jgi:hypothetical protein
MTQFLIDDAGWVQSVEVIRSPNFDARPDDARIKLIVVHGISLPPGDYGGGYIQEFFCNSLDPAAHSYGPGMRANRSGAGRRPVITTRLVSSSKAATIRPIPGPSTTASPTWSRRCGQSIPISIPTRSPATATLLPIARPTPAPPSNGPGSISCWRMISSRSCLRGCAPVRTFAGMPAAKVRLYRGRPNGR